MGWDNGSHGSKRVKENSELQKYFEKPNSMLLRQLDVVSNTQLNNFFICIVRKLLLLAEETKTILTKYLIAVLNQQ